MEQSRSAIVVKRYLCRGCSGFGCAAAFAMVSRRASLNYDGAYRMGPGGQSRRIRTRIHLQQLRHTRLRNRHIQIRGHPRHSADIHIQGARHKRFRCWRMERRTGHRGRIEHSKIVNRNGESPVRHYPPTLPTSRHRCPSY
mgnify:CR=1 FL=1